MSRETLLNVAILAGLLAVALGAWASGQPFVVQLATRAAILGMAGVGLNLALGYGGLVSFGHAAFFGIGGYAAGILASAAQNYEPLMTWPLELPGTTSMPVIWLTAVIAAGLVALPIGALSLRTGGVHFIMITLAFAQMIYYFAISWPAYGGEDGLSIYVRNSLGTLNTMDPLTFFLIAFALLLLVLGLVLVATRSRFGLALAMARQNPLRLTSMGVRPFKVRLTAFVLSAMAVALAGALYADLNRFVSPTMLSWHLSGELIVFVILGGVGRPCGPLIGACVYVLLEQWLGGLTEYWQLPLGIILLLVVLFARGGVIGLVTGRNAHA
ncbi:branched-chain amino acid ABC transporter permease [Amaricoccus sp.]|uniref:branched-chain amino acid ABC transporter permease n=1 Tax=Amaricoccus sp. TaxID=1872485 RepID=UPI001B4875C3|nr:branched-chain amino acid ABC transporter permease [Amaricoccus sp.]MBP7002538.1 branched-chain amino acid ABC transporter permease [Amaricoccus sp.]